MVMGWESEIRNDVAESKMAREMLRFTIETAVVGLKGRICGTAGAGYVRAALAVVRIGTVVYRLRSANQCAEYYWGMQLQMARRLIMVGSSWWWVADGGAVLLGNAGSRWSWVADGGAVLLVNATAGC